LHAFAVEGAMERYVSEERIARFRKHALRGRPIKVVELPRIERVVLEPISYRDLGLGLPEKKVA
jgi:hypothetical protein